jgi:hypothetical protein
LGELKRFMTTKHGGDAVNACFHGIQGIIINSLKSVQNVIINDKRCFEMYGYDVMIDADLKPWLIEVNASPSMSSDTQSDHDLKFGLLDDMLTVIDLEGEYFPITTFRLPDCPYETDTFFFISRRTLFTEEKHPETRRRVRLDLRKWVRSVAELRRVRKQRSRVVVAHHAGHAQRPGRQLEETEEVVP